MRYRNRHSGYIWQREGWPEFVWDSDQILEPLARLNNLHGQLQGQMLMLGFKDKGKACLEAMSEELVSSSKIEGVDLVPQSVRSSIARHLGIESDGLFVEDHYVEGLVSVMLDAVNNCSQLLTSERFYGWHSALFPTGRSGMYKIAVGCWRQGNEPMQVVSGAFGHEKIHYEAPPSSCVPEEMAKLIDWCNNADKNPFLMAAIAHLWFVSVHPFDDGNGRIARTLTDMLLARLDDNGKRYYSMSAEIIRNKKSYYEVLELTQRGDLDITRWLLWFFDCLESAIKRAFGVVETTLQKTNYWSHFADVEINERQRKVVNRLWDGFEGKLTTSKWAKICSCSQDTALRDINDLISKGMLRSSEEGGRSTNYILVK